MVASMPVPVTADILKKAFEHADFIEIPATIHDYWQLIELPQYRLDYTNHQIKGTMSYGSLPHEAIISNLLVQLSIAFEDNGFQIFGSNRPLFAEGCNDIFEADIHMAQLPLLIHEYDKTKTATKNPHVIVEVHSPSTRNYDLTDKLECYKAIPTVQQIIYIESTSLKVTTFNRTSKPNHWLTIDYKNPDFKVKILNKFVPMSKIYKNTKLV